MKTIYLTTPLYYVNAAPHLGHSYTTIAADCLARYHRLAGRSVFLLTGTDEHGQKIQQAAQTAGLSPQAFADRAVEQFASLWTLLEISHDEFIRTTQPRHQQAVQAIVTKLHAAGQLTRARYQGWYCTPEETFWTEAELGEPRPSGPEGRGGRPAGTRAPLCPACQRPLESVSEDGWMLPLRASQPWLKRYVETHEAFVQPATRRNELLALLERPLPEALCITRPRQRVDWGIPVPFSPEHVVYVWFDALLNYITVPGYVEDPARFAQLWPADVHFIGKDILRHHAVYWPIMLHALQVEEMPRMVFAHGWWKVGEQKMSKSLGNIVDPTAVIGQLLQGQPFAADIYRYFLLREIPFGQDGHFSEEALVTRLNADLANDLGNLVNRTLSMITGYHRGTIPPAGPHGQPLAQAAMRLAEAVSAAMDRLEFSAALESIMRVVAQANQYVESSAPWKLAKAGDTQTLSQVLGTLGEVLRIVAIVLEPFMPAVAQEIWRQLGCGERPRRLADAGRWPGLETDQPIGRPSVLFPKKAS